MDAHVEFVKNGSGIHPCTTGNGDGGWATLMYFVYDVYLTAL